MASQTDAVPPNPAQQPLPKEGELQSKDPPELPARSGATNGAGGAPLLLELLGGILLAASVACAGPLVNCLLQPFRENNAASASAHAFAHLAYLGLLLNLFRQIHGLAIVVSDHEYDIEVGRYLGLTGHMISTAGLILVLALPALLLAVLCSENAVPLRFLIDYVGISPAEHGIMVILFFLAATALAYFLWDIVSLQQCSGNRVDTRPRGWLPYVSADGYREFLYNWILLCAYALIVAIIACLLSVGLATFSGIPLIPSLLGGKAVLLIILLLTYGYSLLDYYVNRNFYFRHQRLEQLRASRATRSSPMKISRRFVAIIGTGLVVGVLGLFYVASQPPAKLVLQLKWLYNAGFAGDFVAKDKFWKGLDVEIRPGGIGIDPIKQVTSGSAQIGVATGDQLLLAIANEKSPVVAIALVYQDNPLAWIARKDTGITGPADLRGRRVGLTYTDDEPLFQAMLERVGLTDTDLAVERIGFDATKFLRNEVDAYPVFRNTQGTQLSLQLAKDRIETVFVAPSDIGIVSYSNLYFTTRDFAENHHDEVVDFIRGVLRGWHYAQGEVRETSLIVARYDKDTNTDVIKQCVVATNKLVKPADNVVIGSMSKEGWEDTQAILLAAGLVKEKVNVEDVFTNEFVEAASNGQ